MVGLAAAASLGAETGYQPLNTLQVMSSVTVPETSPEVAVAFSGCLYWFSVLSSNFGYLCSEGWGRIEEQEDFSILLK